MFKSKPNRIRHSDGRTTLNMYHCEYLQNFNNIVMNYKKKKNINKRKSIKRNVTD